MSLLYNCNPLFIDDFIIYTKIVEKFRQRRLFSSLLIRENHHRNVARWRSVDGAREIPCFYVSIGISELDRKRARLRTIKSMFLADGDKNTRFDGGG